MVARQFNQKQYEAVEEYILSSSQNSPVTGIYEVGLTVNSERYTVFLQPDRRCKINVLCAQRGSGREIITSGALLTALFELVAAQVL